MKYRVEETAQHHSVYEIEADSEEEALAKLAENYEPALTEEFWGKTTREISEIPEDLTSLRP